MMCVCLSLVFAACSHIYYFFFFKQKTAYEMRISDWSSDVCSSDLVATFAVSLGALAVGAIIAIYAAGRLKAVFSAPIMDETREPQESYGHDPAQLNRRGPGTGGAGAAGVERLRQCTGVAYQAVWTGASGAIGRAHV